MKSVIVVAAIPVYVPNSLENLCPSEDNAEIGSMEYKVAVFKTGKVDFHSALKYPALVPSDFQSQK